MFKRLLTLTLLPSLLSALSIEVKLAKSKGERYSILNLQSSEPFYCSKVAVDEANKYLYSCEFEREPKEKFEGFESEFFVVKPIKGGRYKLSILSKTPSEIFSQNYDPKTSYAKKSGFERRAKKFVIVAYEGELKFIQKPKPPKLNFPIALNSDPFVYVKALDVDGLPINDANALEDIAAFKQIKKMYETGDYKGALKEAEKAQKANPNSIFFSEYELIRIKSLVAMGGSTNNTAATELALAWLKNFPADEKTPEVLIALMNAYAHNQDFKNAEYYFERIVNDYGFLEASKQAMIDYGDALRSLKTKKAIELYKRALYETKSIETASIAAFKIADTLLSTGNAEGAKEYYAKVLKSNMAFVTKDKKKAYSFAKKLAGALIYSQAIEVGEAILPNLNKKDEEYELLLSDIGEWCSMSGDLNKAKAFFERYLREYPNGRFAHIIEAKLDKLNFGQKGQLGDVELAKLAEKYPSEEIGQKALLKLLKSKYEAKAYGEVLALEPKTKTLPPDLLKEAESIIIKSEQRLLAEYLAKSECKEALAILDRNRVKALPNEEGRLFECLLKNARGQRAYEIAAKRVQTGDILQKVGWLYNLERAAMQTGKTKEAYAAAKDVLTLKKAYKISEYSDIAFDAATLALEYKDASMMADAIALIESAYPKDPRAIAAYKAAARYAISKNDELLTLRYTAKLYTLQNKLNAFVESPWVELNYASSLSKAKKHREAISVLQSAKNRKMSESDRARVLFEISSNYLALGDKKSAKTALEECIKTKGESSWKSLCKEGIDILK